MEEQLAPLRHAAEIKLHGERLRIDPDAIDDSSYAQSSTG